jgi:hypothetical protein
MNTNDTPIETRTEEEIHHLLDFMGQQDKYTDEYKSMFNQLTKVMELQQQKQVNDDTHMFKLTELEQKSVISKEAWLTVGTHIAGLIVLMNHERAHVIASKAFGLVKKIF